MGAVIMELEPVMEGDADFTVHLTPVLRNKRKSAAMRKFVQGWDKGRRAMSEPGHLWGSQGWWEQRVTGPTSVDLLSVVFVPVEKRSAGKDQALEDLAKCYRFQRFDYGKPLQADEAQFSSLWKRLEG
ncbi:hypothetical protein J6590_032848 [Homalodisca vitripennis]|nr:hypothetical protein J6590_032848 [Homalodisca vitripennis]